MILLRNIFHALNSGSAAGLPGLRWTRGRPGAQILLGLTCGALALAAARAVLSIQLGPGDVLLFFMGLKAPVWLAAAALMVLALAASFMLFGALAALAWLFYAFTMNGLQTLWPWGARRFHCLGLAFFYMWAVETLFHMLLFVLYATDIGSHVFVVLYAGKGLEFLYGFLLHPWYYAVTLCVAYPLAERFSGYPDASG